jgi:hypothetical protein
MNTTILVKKITAFGEKKLAIALCVTALLAAGCGALSKKTDEQTPAQDQNTPAQIKKPETTPASIWQGTLKTSDNSKKGNLMLVTDKTTVYINTSRDFSNLIGKSVNVKYQGSLDNFELGNISEN